jgi:hypothetical protein
LMVELGREWTSLQLQLPTATRLNCISPLIRIVALQLSGT